MRQKFTSQSKYSFYNPFDVMSFTYDRCYLCGNQLKGNNSVEHIFPKWLQNKYDLWNQKLNLPNQTDIPYRNLTIPCCHTCNTGCLSSLENTIKLFQEKGYSEFRKIDKIVIFQWIGKIFFGLLFKELSLLEERSNVKNGTIVSPEILEEYRMLHAFLQSIRVPFEFVGRYPCSVFIVETQTYGDKRDFDYTDDVVTLTFSMRMGEIGIITCLRDN